MTDKLIRIFIKDNENLENPMVRTAYGKFASIIGIVCNVILFLGKILVGVLSGSVSITADAVNNLSDASSSIISLFGFKLSAKPADKEHPYGHGRYEYLSGLMVAVLIMVIGIELFRSSLNKILSPTLVLFHWASIGVLLASIFIKLWMMVFYKKIGKKIDSGTLAATAMDSRNDVITTLSVLIATLVSHFLGIELDGYMGLLVAIFIVWSGFSMIKDTISPLLGHAPDAKTVNTIREKIMTYPGVLGTHDLLIHDYGPGRQFASVHVEMAAEDDVLESHDTIDQIEQDFLQTGLHMLVHYDPIITTGEETTNLRKWLMHLIQQIDASFTIHDLRVVPGKTRTKLVFDCVIPEKYEMSDLSVKENITAQIKAAHPHFETAITIDRGFAAIPIENMEL